MRGKTRTAGDSEWAIGDRIFYAARYSPKAADRFAWQQDGSYQLTPELEWVPVLGDAPIAGDAFVTGVSVRAMADWVPHTYITTGGNWPGQDAETEYVPPQWTGEMVLLCREWAGGKEFVVRPQDARKLEVSE